MCIPSLLIMRECLSHSSFEAYNWSKVETEGELSGVIGAPGVKTHGQVQWQ